MTEVENKPFSRTLKTLRLHPCVLNKQQMDPNKWRGRWQAAGRPREEVTAKPQEPGENLN